MNKPFQMAIDFCIEYKNKLQQLQTHHNAPIILCPTYPALFPVAQQLEDTDIAVGAQDCSTHIQGAFTGQVDALSLQQAGCTYCIVGHSERRQSGDTNEMVAEKTMRILEQGMTPIICIGETKDQFENKETYHILEAQLQTVFQKLQKNRSYTCIIAYEPVWSIGTGVIPQPQYLLEVFAWLRAFIDEQVPYIKAKIVYGGSVDKTNISQLKKINHINGFLIGGASLDFQKLQNIVEYT